MHNNDGDDDDNNCDGWVSDCDVDDDNNDDDDNDVDDDDDNDWATTEALGLIGLFNSILSSDNNCASYITTSIPIVKIIMI